MQYARLNLSHRLTDWPATGPSRPILTGRQYAWIMLAFIAFVIYGSLVPLTFQSVPIAKAWDRYEEAFSQPVAVDNRADWLANILLFIPLGFVAMGWRCVDKYRLSPLPIVLILISCSMLSAAIEFTQLYFPPRQTSINDVVAETLGGAIGVLGWLVAGQQVTDYVRQLWGAQGEANWALRLLPGYLVFLVFVHGMPFDLTLSPDLLKKKFHEGRVLLIPFEGDPLKVIEKRLINIAYFLPVGILIAGLRGWLGRGNWAWLRVFAIGLALAGGIEFMQLLVLTRYFDSTDIVTGSLAVLAGWQCTRLWQLHQPVRVGESPAFSSALRLGMFLFWAAALLFINWEPFDFATQDWQQRVGEISWVPFADYYAGNYLSSFDEIVQKTVLFVPFGFLLSSWTRSRFDAALAVFSGVLLAVFIEIGQLFLVQYQPGVGLVALHHPGVSDLILEGFGAWAGALAAQRLRILTSDIPVTKVVANRVYVR